MTRREAALQALEACLMTVAGATVKRNDPLPTAAPAGGLIILMSTLLHPAQQAVVPPRADTNPIRSACANILTDNALALRLSWHQPVTSRPLKTEMSVYEIRTRTRQSELPRRGASRRPASSRHPSGKKFAYKRRIQRKWSILRCNNAEPVRLVESSFVEE